MDGDGLGLHEANDGGLLATIIAAGFKGIGIMIHLICTIALIVS